MLIDFQKGQPSADILPTELFSKAAVKALSRPNAAIDVLQVNKEGEREIVTIRDLFIDNISSMDMRLDIPSL